MTDGCKYFRSCENCPMDKCYEEYTNVSVFKRKVCELICKKLYKDGWSIWWVSDLTGVSYETVRRWVNQ